jgi:hypothetical protein
VSLALAVLRTLALEIGAGLCFTIAANLRTSPLSKPVPTSVPTTDDGALREAEKLDGGSNEGGSGRSVGHPLISHLRSQGGAIENVGQRLLAKAVGVSKTEINRMLQDLAATGAIAVQADRLKGTSVQLIAA